jgi:hypothetical protein
MYEVWWADDGQERLRARFRTLPDALRFAANANHTADARLRHNGRWEPVSRYRSPQTSRPPEPDDNGRIGSVDPVVLALEVGRRCGVHDIDLVLTIVRETLMVLEQHADQSPR